MKKLLSILLVVMLVLSMIPATVSAAATEITFNLGANGSASHNDGSEKSSYSETANGYTLSITGGSKMYTGARDAKGNSCLKLGTGSAAGKFSFTVPNDVTSVVIHVAKYKANTSKLTVNGTTHTLTKASNNGQYDAITVDTSSQKTVSVTTVSGGYRAMVNTIVYVIAPADGACRHENTTTTTVDATCTVDGSTTVTCDDCGETVKTETILAGHDWNESAVTTPATCTSVGVLTTTCSKCTEVKTEEIPMLPHTYVDGICTECGAEEPNEVVFELGENGSASHYDGSEKTTYTDAAGDYTLSLTNGSKMYTGARDAKGNSCLKLGTGSAVGGFTFTVPDNVVQVKIYAAKYKESKNACEILVNGATYKPTNVSNEGKYDEIVIDTTSEKTITLSTTKNGYRAMLNTIVFCFEDEEEGACQHESTTTTTVDATCTKEGSVTVVCNACGETVSEEVLGVVPHTYVDGVCECGAVKPVVTNATYVFADYAAGEQYAENEEHVMDDNVSIYTTQSHFTTQLRIYSSSAHDGYAVIESSEPIESIAFKAGYKADDLAIYGSDNGEQWKLLDVVKVTSASYKDYASVKFATAYNMIKLDVQGTEQIRLENLTLNFKQPVPVKDKNGQLWEDISLALSAGLNVLTSPEGEALPAEVVLNGRERYITLGAEGGVYTYYALNLKMSNISLRSKDAGIYYSAAFNMDNELRALLTSENHDVSYGIMLSLEGKPTTFVEGQYTSVNGLPTTEKIHSGSVFNIFKEDLTLSQNQERALMDIHASVYIKIDELTIVSHEYVAWNFVDVLEGVNKMVVDPNADLKDTQINALKAFYTKWEKVFHADWNLDNIADL